MICASLPFVRALLPRWFPSVFSVTSRGTAARDYNGNTGRSATKSRDFKLSSLNTGTHSAQINTSKGGSSVSKLRSVEEALSSSEDVIASSHENGERRRGKCSDEITFFYVGHGDEPSARLEKNHISKQVVVSVHSSPTDQSEKSAGWTITGK
jgi:hypothetical protein